MVRGSEGGNGPNCVPLTHDSYVEALPPNVMVLEDETVGK